MEPSSYLFHFFIKTIEILKKDQALVIWRVPGSGPSGGYFESNRRRLELFRILMGLP